MDYEIGTELLIQSPSNTWTPAVVEEDDGDEIFIAYVEGNVANEWINKDSHRIKSKNEEEPNKLMTPLSQPANIIPDFKSITNKRTINVPSTEKEKKSTSSNRLSSTIFKVKFKKDDFLSKKSQDSKHKEQKAIKDNKKSSDSETKPPLLHNSPTDEKIFSNASLEHPNVVENTEMEIETSTDITDALIDSKSSNETNVIKSENFEELLEDIEAEAEICSPTKLISHGNSKQKKKKKKYFGQRRRPEKKKKSQRSRSGNKNVSTVKLNSPKVNSKEDSLQKRPSRIDDIETIPPKRVKPSLSTLLASSSEENSVKQNSSFHLFANNTLLQKIKMDASDEQGFRCPKQECRKLFRKENLLMMHIKHYHAEYTELLVSTPNVTDLATARIEGENVDELSPSFFLHRISQLEAKRNTSFNSPSLSTISSSVKNEPEPESNTSLQSDNFNSTFTSSEKQTGITQSYVSKDSGFSGNFGSVIDTPAKYNIQTQDPIKKITLVDDFTNETRDSFDSVCMPGSSRHFKIKKNKSKIESLPKEEVINCSCGTNQEDGLMIQCDVCLCWQHGCCNKIDSEDQVPDNYICTSCLNPSKKRQSKQYEFIQDWITDGKVASVLPHKDDRRKKDESILKQSHQLVAEVVEHYNFLHSLLVKIAIYGQTPDHPKLYLWSEQGSKINEDPPPDKLDEILTGPVPEKPINTAECRKNLLDEIEDGFDNIDARINLFEAKTNGLLDQVNGTIDNEVLSSTLNLLVRDLNSIRHYLILESKNREPKDVQ